ncbi:MAG TPA: ATP-binding protein [Steroidobacteraceae bacterium]|jgi:signal transduction histidine kinase/ActR/RegA family two-component response regulator|nr:ATP-binding protein [Steroidobacteraceae bacterium]
MASAPALGGRALRRRLILVVLGVCGAVWLSTAFDTLRDRRQTLAESERQLDNVSGALAEQAARALQATDLILQQAGLLDPDAPGAPRDRAAIPDLLRRHMSGVPQVRNLFLYDPARQIYFTSAPAALANQDLTDRSYYKAQRDNPNLGLYLSEPFLSRVTGDPTFVLSRRLAGEGFRGIAGAAVDIPYIRRFYHALDLGAGSTIELLRADGTALISREHGTLASGPSPWEGALRALGDRDALRTVIDYPELGRTEVSLRRVAGYPAIVAVGRAEAAILADWRTLAWTNLARTFVITALAAVLLVAFLRRLGRDERMAAELHQSQKLEALGTLAGGIAHDFNNVLGAILGYGELALEHTSPGSAQRRYVDNIIIAANRARELVARILAFSRPGVGSASPLVLQKVLTEVRNLASVALPPQVSVALRVPERPLVVAGDQAQLHQMFANLISNAVQAVGERGRVEIVASEFSVDAERACTVGRLHPGAYARVDVIDTGVGMNAAQVERIFDPFFTTKPVGKGTGLGLSLVHGTVLDHGAALEVASRSGTGTTFSVYLPLASGEPLAEPRPVPAPVGKGETVLVVDDEESLVHLAEEVLASLGYEPVGCLGPAQALRVFRAQPERFDAVLSDAIMPDMPGTELLRELKRLRPDLVTVLVSGYGGPDLQAQAQAAGVQAVLAKPLRAAELAECLAAVLGGDSRRAAVGAGDAPAAVTREGVS